MAFSSRTKQASTSTPSLGSERLALETGLPEAEADKEFTSVRSVISSTTAATAVTLSLAVLSGCNGTGSSILQAPQSSYASQFGAGPLAAGCEHGKSGVGRQSPRTEFYAKGRYIEEKTGTKAAHNFFVKGMAYSPTPIGNGVSDPPSCDDPLRNDNKAIWSRDLPLLRAMGVNAIRVFNVSPPPWDKDLGTIDEFLDAAWNNGKDPIFVIMTISFPGTALENRDAARDIAGQYQRLAAKYALNPAVMGVSIGNEITGGNPPTLKPWWDNFNLVVQGAKAGFASKGVRKIVTSADFDGLTTFEVNGRKQIRQIYYGEKYGAQVDVWGDNIYRGRWYTDLLEQIQDTTTKPVLLTEYGATAAYHPAWANTYEYPGRESKKNGDCVPVQRSGPLNRDVDELPQGDEHNPNMAGLVDYATNMAQLTFDAYQNSGYLAGGFYFEWTDEWWKADANNPAFRSKHVGDEKFVGWFPGCGNDAAWYGLNSISQGGELNELTPRPTLEGLKNTWQGESP